MPKAKIPSALPPLVSLGWVAELTGLSRSRISVLTTDGYIPRNPDGTYDPRAAAQAWAAYERGESPRRTIEEQKAEKLKRENSQARGELMEIQDYYAAIDRMCATLKTWFRSLPGRISSIGAMTEAPVLHELIRVECARASEEIRECAADGFTEVLEDMDEDAQTDTHSGRVGLAN